MAPSNDPNIPKLLTALAAAARASNNLPLHNTKKNDNSSNSDDEDDDEDEFAYQWTFPEFSSQMCNARSIVLQIIGECLSIQDEHFDATALDQINVEFDWDDQEAIVSLASNGNIGINVWNESFDCQESLLEQVERYLQGENRKNTSNSVSNAASSFSSFKSKRGDKGLNLVISNTVDMDKPQTIHKFELDNSRTSIWTPPFIDESDLPTPQVGHGLAFRDKSNKKNDSEMDSSSKIIAPTMHYPHPYQDKIESFKYTSEQLTLSKENPSSTLMKPMDPNETCHFIDTEEQISDLSKLITKLEINLMAVDLEHHSYRSFHGFTCLMQISFRVPLKETESSTTTQTYLVDTIKLRPYIHKYLSPFFLSPTIVKVMHGANSDVQWLQRDFGIYILNLFDTSIASRLLKLPSAALAYLLKKYAGLTEIDLWKSKYQLGDWRVRPLEEGMFMYAMGDTHYLLDIYDKLREELVKKGHSGVIDGEVTKEVDNDQQARLISIRSVLDASRKICLIRYTKDPFDPDAYKRLISNRKSSNSSTIQSRLTPVQTTILEQLWDWRDVIARELDESIVYICNNRALLRIAMAVPHNVSKLQGLLNPMPVIIMRYSQQVLDIIRNAKNQNITSNEKKESYGDYFKVNDKTIDAPTSHLILDDIDDFEKEADMEVLDISSFNHDFSSYLYTNHSLEMGNIIMTNEKVSKYGRSATVDGLGAARMALLGEDNSFEMEVKQAQISAKRVCQNLAVIKKWNHDAWFKDDGMNKRKDDDEKHENRQTNDIERDEVPQSVRERYGSNNKKRKESPTNDMVNDTKKTKKEREKTPKKASEKQTLKSFDYSKTNIFSLLDPAVSNAENSNPFFSGAAVNLGSTSGLSSANKEALQKSKERKEGKKVKKDGDRKVKSPKIERPTRRDPNKMVVYKP